MSLQPRPPSPNFKMQDFRLFYNFISDAYPHHPIDNDDIWTHEIPSIAHNHDYLLHAMLALSASEILESEPDQALACTAISHRISAIKALKASISQGFSTSEDANATLATCYALVHQSALLEDGICEFMTFTRGCVMVLWHMSVNQLPLLFRNIMKEAQLNKMGPHLQGGPGFEGDEEVVNEARASLEAIESMCNTHGERLMYKYMMEIVNALPVSKRDAYIGLMHIYGCFCYEMSQHDFQIFIAPDNEIGKLLMAHFVVVQSLLDSITVHELGSRVKPSWHTGSMRWMRPLIKDINPKVRRYYDWPISHTEKVWRKERDERQLVANSLALLDDAKTPC